MMTGLSGPIGRLVARRFQARSSALARDEKCEKCGKSARFNTRYCRHCGAWIPDRATVDLRSCETLLVDLVSAQHRVDQRSSS